MGADGVDVRLVVPATSPTPGVTTPAPPPVAGGLPRTGADVTALLLLAALILAAGVLLIRSGRGAGS